MVSGLALEAGTGGFQLGSERLTDSAPLTGLRVALFSAFGL